AILPSVRAGGVEADERDPLPGFLEIEAMRPALEVEPQVSADDRLDRRLADARRRLDRCVRTQAGEELFEEQHVAPERQDVAFDPQGAHTDHADEALVSYRRHHRRELRPGI